MTLFLLPSERDLPKELQPFVLTLNPSIAHTPASLQVMAGSHEDFSPIRLAKECDTE